jgi:hypothetical protein
MNNVGCNITHWCLYCRKCVSHMNMISTHQQSHLISDKSGHHSVLAVLHYMIQKYWLTIWEQNRFLVLIQTVIHQHYWFHCLSFDNDRPYYSSSVSGWIDHKIHLIPAVEFAQNKFIRISGRECCKIDQMIASDLKRLQCCNLINKDVP